MGRWQFPIPIDRQCTARGEKALVPFGSKADMCSAIADVPLYPRERTICRVRQIGLGRLTRQHAGLLGTTSREFVLQLHSLRHGHERYRKPTLLNAVLANFMSALPSRADMCSALVHVRYGPEADINSQTCEFNLRPWWLTGCKRSAGGQPIADIWTVRPSPVERASPYESCSMLKLIKLTGQAPGEVAHMHRDHIVERIKASNNCANT